MNWDISAEEDLVLYKCVNCNCSCAYLRRFFVKFLFYLKINISDHCRGLYTVEITWKIHLIFLEHCLTALGSTVNQVYKLNDYMKHSMSS